MNAGTELYQTWHTDRAAENAMGDSHTPMWRHFISLVPEIDLSTLAVLDFGCNQGGFLRLLYALRPFRYGAGVDIAQESIDVARERSRDLPIEFAATTSLERWYGRIDRAFSYEVIYLLPDLEAHAREIKRTLRPGGIYYAVTGCHTASPLWPAWRTLIAANSNAPVQDYAPEDYAAAFAAAGFDISFKRFGYDDFVPAGKDKAYYPRLTDAFDYPNRDKLLFRCALPSGAN